MSDDNRPIEVGDYVEWRPSQSTHIKGEIVSFLPGTGRRVAEVRVDYDRVHPSPASWQGERHHLMADGLRRIPRPEVQSTRIVQRRGRCDLGCVEPCKHGLPYRVSEPAPTAPVLVDPLDVEYDGVRLRRLLEGDEFNRRETSVHWRAKTMTPAQRAAVSAHWSAALRAKIAAGAEAERWRVTYCEVEPWE